MTQTPLQENCEPRSAPGARTLLIARGFDDLGEAARVEAGAADERAVDVGLAHEFAGILRFHAAAVLNPHSLGCGLIGHFAQGVANERVRFLRLLGCCIAPGADRPDRLVRNHCFLQFLWTQTSETAAQLDRQYFFNVAFVALLERFSDANDRTQCRLMRRAHFRLTISSVSPNNVRRSLCPSTT